MAQRTVVTYIDDLDGSNAEGTFTFALDGAEYEIDLSSANFELLQKSLQPFLDAGRRVRRGRTPATAKPVKRSQAERTAELRAVREWAAKAGMPVTTRGRIPAPVQEAYDAAH